MSLIISETMFDGNERRFRVSWWRDSGRVREQWEVFSKSRNRWIEPSVVQSEYIISHKRYLLGKLTDSIPTIPTLVLDS